MCYNVSVFLTPVAGEMAYHGHRVTLYDANLTTLNTVYPRLMEDKQLLRDEGLLPTQSFVVNDY